MRIRITNHVLHALPFPTDYSYSSCVVSLWPWRIKLSDYVKAASFITFTKIASITFIFDIMFLFYIESNFSALNAEIYSKQQHFLEINKILIFYTNIPLNEIFYTCMPAKFTTFQIKKNSRHSLTYVASIYVICMLNALP